MGTKAMASSNYLPMEINGARVVIQESNGKWKVTNSSLRARTEGLVFRKSKNLKDRSVDDRVLWEEIVDGIDEGDGWLRVIEPDKKAQTGSAVMQAMSATNGMFSHLWEDALGDGRAPGMESKDATLQAPDPTSAVNTPMDLVAEEPRASVHAVRSKTGAASIGLTTNGPSAGHVLQQRRTDNVVQQPRAENGSLVVQQSRVENGAN